MRPAGKSKIVMNYYYNPGIQIMNCNFARIDKWKYSSHSLPLWRLYITKTRGAFIHWKKRRIELIPDNILLIAPNTVIKTENQRPLEQFYIHFTANTPFDNLDPNIFVLPLPNEEASILEKMQTCFNEESFLSPSFALLTFSLINLVLWRIPKEKLLHPSLEREIIKVLNFMEQNPDRLVSNEELAKHVNMSKNNLLKIFKQNIGVSPQVYYREQRLKKACLLLKHTDMSIDEIAAQTGFCDRYHFSRNFKKLFAVGPATFRKRK